MDGCEIVKVASGKFLARSLTRLKYAGFRDDALSVR